MNLPLPGHYRPGSIGKPVPDSLLLRVADPDLEGEGEIAIWGRSVMMGYLNQEEKTREAIDDDGWFKTGDIGTKDEYGYYYISGLKSQFRIF